MGDRCDVTSGRGLLSRCGPVRSVLGTVPYGVRCAQRASERVSRRSTPPSVARLPSHHPCLPAFVSSIPWTLLTEHVRPPAIMLDVVVVAGYDVVSACQRHRPWTRRTHPPTRWKSSWAAMPKKRQAGLSAPSVRSGPWLGSLRNIPGIMPLHGRIASGLQKGRAASQSPLLTLTFLQLHNTSSSPAGRYRCYSVFTGRPLPSPSFRFPA